MAAFQWLNTNAILFKELDYDNSVQTDHFFADYLRLICDLSIKEGKTISFKDFFDDILNNGPGNYRILLNFFDGLTKDETRFRWDRLICLHLLLMAFINTLGYKRQLSKQEQFKVVAERVNNRQILSNLGRWLERFDLFDKEAKKVKKVL